MEIDPRRALARRRAAEAAAQRRRDLIGNVLLTGFAVVAIVMAGAALHDQSRQPQAQQEQGR